MVMVLDGLSWVFILGGLFFMIVGTVGILRMPDVYTRLHTAGMTDTLGAGFLLLGMGLQTVEHMTAGELHFWTVGIRLLFVYLFLLFTSPIGTHALARAALHGGLEPYRLPMTQDGVHPGDVPAIDAAPAPKEEGA